MQMITMKFQWQNTNGQPLLMNLLDWLFLCCRRKTLRSCVKRWTLSAFCRLYLSFTHSSQNLPPSFRVTVFHLNFSAIIQHLNQVVWPANPEHSQPDSPLSVRPRGVAVQRKVGRSISSLLDSAREVPRTWDVCVRARACCQIGSSV